VALSIDAISNVPGIYIYIYIFCSVGNTFEGDPRKDGLAFLYRVMQAYLPVLLARFATEYFVSCDTLVPNLLEDPDSRICGA
jgi:hypothetical protein